MAEDQWAAGPSGEGVRKYFYFIKEKVSSDWRDLAFHLGFKHADIENIAGRNRDDKSRCMDLLEEWLKRNGDTATIEALMEALLKTDLQSVVDGLRNTYPELLKPVPALSVASGSQTGGSPCTVDGVISCLKDLYATEYAHVRPLPWCEDLNLPLEVVYTNLQLQSRDGWGRFEDANTIVSLADIYKTSEDNRSAERKISVEGPHGIGKSCSCQKLAFDWSSGKLNKFKAVFLLEMRHLHGKVKDEIFEHLLPKDASITPAELWSFIQENQDKVLFILDGLDELSQRARETTDVVDLIQGKILRNCHVLVTSRPCHCVTDLEKCHEFYKIVGYSKENSTKFIQIYFHKTPGSATKLLEQLERNEDLSELVVNPLYNVLICVVWEDCREELPSNKSELYKIIVYVFAKRFCIKTDIPFDDDKFSPNIQAALRGLGKLSWEGLQQDQFQFNIHDIKVEYAVEANDMLNIGFLTRDYSLSRIKRTCYCAFLHKTFQEYMAAYYISELVMNESKREEGLECLRKLFGITLATADDADNADISVSRRKYVEVQNLVPVMLGEKSAPLFELFAQQLSSGRCDGDDMAKLSFISIMSLGRTCGSRKMAEILAPCLAPHVSNLIGKGRVLGWIISLFVRFPLSSDDHTRWFDGFTEVIRCQTKLARNHEPRLIQHLKIDCTDIMKGLLKRQQLDMIENTLSDCATIRSVTLFDTTTFLHRLASIILPLAKPEVSPVAIFVPRCGVESVSIDFEATQYSGSLTMANLLEELSTVSRIEHVKIAINRNYSCTAFSEYDRLLAKLIVKQSCLMSLTVKVDGWTCQTEETMGFGNLISTLQNISEHKTLEIVEFTHPLDDPRFRSSRSEAPVESKMVDVEAMVHKLTACIDENKVLKRLQLSWKIGEHSTPYKAICSNQSVTDLCRAIERNKTLEILIIDGMFSGSEGHQEIIDQLMRNKPANFQELRIAMAAIPRSECCLI